jgi:hypothetical protein
MDLLMKSFISLGDGVEQEPRNGVKDGIATKVSLSLIESDNGVLKTAGLEPFVGPCPTAGAACIEPQADNKMTIVEVSK